MLWWWRDRGGEGGFSWSTLLLSERCLLKATVERATDISSRVSPPVFPSNMVMVRALSRGMSSTGTRTVLRAFESRELDLRWDSRVKRLLLLAELEARRLQAA